MNKHSKSLGSLIIGLILHIFAIATFPLFKHPHLYTLYVHLFYLIIWTFGLYFAISGVYNLIYEDNKTTKLLFRKLFICLIVLFSYGLFVISFLLASVPTLVTLDFNSDSNYFPSSGKCEVVTSTIFGEVLTPQIAKCNFTAEIDNGAYYFGETNVFTKSHTIFARQRSLSNFEIGDDVMNLNLIVYPTKSEENKTISGVFEYPITSQIGFATYFKLNATIKNLGGGKNSEFRTNQDLGYLSSKTITWDKFNKRRREFLYALWILITAGLFSIPAFVNGSAKIFDNK